MRRWEALQGYSETFTCYSAAMAAWLAHEDAAWPEALNPGLWLLLSSEGHGRFAFSHFPAGLRAKLGLRRAGADAPAGALEGVMAELERSGRVIVAGDGYNLPWHVAHGRRHVPHWFVLSGSTVAPVVLDPFAARNELGVQEATHRPLDVAEVGPLLRALPREDRVFALREMLAFGDLTPPDDRPWQWFVRDGAEDTEAPVGPSGPDAIEELARHFRDAGQAVEAYAQADDIWSIARHRAFLAAYAAAVAEDRGDAALQQWVAEHALPLAKRWGHMAPLMMQATLTLSAGRTASSSVPDTLQELAGRERAAAQAFPGAAPAGTIAP